MGGRSLFSTWHLLKLTVIGDPELQIARCEVPKKKFSQIFYADKNWGAQATFTTLVTVKWCQTS